MATAVIVDAVRTAGGKRNGKLKDWHPVELAAQVLQALAGRNNLDPALVDDVVMGCVGLLRGFRVSGFSSLGAFESRGFRVSGFSSVRFRGGPGGQVC